MKFTFSTFGQDLLKVLSVATVIAEAAEPIVDLTQPGIAQVYNLSAQQSVALVDAFLGQQQTAAAPTAAPASDPVPAEPASEAIKPGPGLHSVVPA